MNSIHKAAATKEWLSKWRYIANAILRIAQNYGEQSYFRRF